MRHVAHPELPAEFWVRRGVIGTTLLLVSVLGVVRHFSEPVLDPLSAATLVAVCLSSVNELWRRKNPAFRITSSALVHRSGLVARTREFPFDKVKLWRISAGLLMLDMTSPAQVNLSLRRLPRAERLRLKRTLHIVLPEQAATSHAV